MQRRLARSIAVAGLIATPLLAYAKEPLPYPAKPIRLIVPTTAGGPPDLVGRLIGEKLAAAMGQAVVVDNRPGATGTIGLAVVARSAGDGYTLGVMGMPSIVAQSLVARMPYDTEKDLVPITLVNWHYHVFAVPGGSPVKSVADFIEAAKARPGALKYSSGGNGTPAHLTSELLKREAVVNITHIPYKGAPAGVQALLSGEVDIMIGAASALLPHIKAGKLRALATPAPQRFAAYPDVPTFAELGLPGVQIRDWQGIVAPAGTTAELIARLHAQIARAAMLPDVKVRMEGMGMEAVGVGPKEFGPHVRSEIRTWNRLVRDAGIQAD